MTDAAAERAVLAGICSYGGESYYDVVDILTERSFTIDSNRAIWNCLDYTFKNAAPGEDIKIDYPSIIAASKALSLGTFFEKVTEQKHLYAILDLNVKSENVRKLAGRVRKLEIARLCDKQLDEAKSNLAQVTGDEPIDRIVSLFETPILDFSSLLKETSGPQPLGQGAREYVQYLLDNPREMIGISTGFRRYDRAIGGGLRGNALDIIGARLKCGKSGLAANIGVNIASQKIPTLSIDTEMSREEQWHRILANMSNIPVTTIEQGKVFNADKERLFAAISKLESIPYEYQSVIGLSFEDVLASMRRWVVRRVGLNANGQANPCVIIYDYLKLLSSAELNKNMAEYQLLGFITTALKNFAGRYNLPILCFAQTNREGIDKEDTDVVAGSDRIAQYCTSVTLYREKSEDERAEGDEESLKYTHKLVPLVARHGEGLKRSDYINIQAQYKYGRVTEGPTRFELSMGMFGDANDSVKF